MCGRCILWSWTGLISRRVICTLIQQQQQHPFRSNLNSIAKVWFCYNNIQHRKQKTADIHFFKFTQCILKQIGHSAREPNETMCRIITQQSQQCHSSLSTYTYDSWIWSSCDCENAGMVRSNNPYAALANSNNNKCTFSLWSWLPRPRCRPMAIPTD